MPSSAARPRRPDRARPRTGGWSVPPSPTRWRGSPASSRRSRRSRRSAREAARGSSPVTAPRRRRSSRSAPSWTCSGRSSPGRPFLEAEVAWAARHELALSLDDVLARRTRLAQELPDRGAAVAPRVAGGPRAELGWGESPAGARGRDATWRRRRREFAVAPPERANRPRRRMWSRSPTERRRRVGVGRFRAVTTQFSGLCKRR